MPNPFAVITGAASGIGLELARIAARGKYDLLLAAPDPAVQAVVDELQYEGIYVEALEVDLGTAAGIDQVLSAADGKQVDMLCIDAGHDGGQGGGQDGGAFMDRDTDALRAEVDVNIAATLHLAQRVLAGMIQRGSGKVLVMRGKAGTGPLDLATKAFADSFIAGLREEIGEHSGIMLATLMPGPTDTGVYEAADRLDSRLAQDAWNVLHVAG